MSGGWDFPTPYPVADERRRISPLSPKPNLPMANLKGFTKVGQNPLGQVEFRGDAKLISCGEFHAHENKNGKPYTWLTVEVIDGFGNPLNVSCIDYSKEESNIPDDGSTIAVKYTERGGDLLFVRSYDDRVSAVEFGHNKIVTSLKDKIAALKAAFMPSAEAAKASRGRGASRQSAVVDEP